MEFEKYVGTTYTDEIATNGDEKDVSFVNGHHLLYLNIEK